MIYEEFKQSIVNSEISDWKYDDEHESYIFLNDIAISIQTKEEDRCEFHEEWATGFPDPKAYRAVFELCYNGVRIEDFHTAAVDGYRMYIPYPQVNTLVMSTEKYRIGRIINISTCSVIDQYDRYLAKAGITAE